MPLKSNTPTAMTFRTRFRPKPIARLASPMAGTLLLVLLLVCGPRWPLEAQNSQPGEYEVKAAFLYNFAKFVEWPPGAFPSRTSPITIGVLSDERFQSVLGQTLIGKTAQDRALVVRRLDASLQDASQCHIVFVSSAERGAISDLLNATKGTSVLTVSETEGFAQRGGMVNFLLIENKVRFEINNLSAKNSGLKISARLLQLAANVWE